MSQTTPQTVMVQFDTQVVEVDVTPLDVGHSSFRTNKLAQSSPDLLLIKPSARGRLVATFFVFLGMVALTVGMAEIFDEIKNKNIEGASPAAFDLTFGLLFAGVGLIFVLLGWGLFLWPKTFGFDRKRGMLTDGKTTKQLTEILAVQILFGGYHISKITRRGRAPSSYFSYQLNLIFKDTQESRLNLSNHSDLDWTRQTAMQLAEFLEVPVLDQIESE